MPPRVLIIDDDVSFRESLAKHLEHAGYVVQQASSGDLGISTFERSPTDVVVVDIFMPGQGGLQTIDRMRRRWPQARIVAISGAKSVGAMDVKGHALALGADRFLEKPFEAATLVALVAALVDVKK
ncbi:MAG TPA: response regulator [Gemmatimonadales bacterium]|nr:response regulator [Gemmatimonadales bacterium]